MFRPLILRDGARRVVRATAASASAHQRDGNAQSNQVCSLKVSGMFCGACAKTVEKAAKRIDGVKAAQVSQAKGLAEITYDPAKTTPDAIAKVLTEKTPFKAEAKQPRDQQT